MSVLPPEVHAALAQLLRALQSTDNALRTQAEETLQQEWIVQRPDVLLMGLAEHIQGADDVAARSHAAVIFRRMATKTQKDPLTNQHKELFAILPEPQRNAIRAKLLESLSGETVASVRNKIGDAIAEVARQYTDDSILAPNGDREVWTELLQSLFHASQSPDPEQREAAFKIFTTTPGIIEKQQQDVLQTVFTKGFADADVSVQLAAMHAFSAFFRSLAKKHQQRYYPQTVNMLAVLAQLRPQTSESMDGKVNGAGSGDSENLTKALMILIELAETAPKMFKPWFPDLVKFSMTVISDKQLDDTARQNALELMATFADFSPQMCRKEPTYTKGMVTQCLSLMTDVGEDDDDAAEWNAAEDLEMDESDLNHVAGEQCMDRLANKLGGTEVLGPTFEWLPRMMQSHSWRDRHAALMAISAISEGCQEQMEGELQQVLGLVVPALIDFHPRVRWAGCNALGQMSTDFKGTMQTKYHQVVLPAIIPVLKSAEPRVQAHAAAALVNFCEEAEKATLEPYLDSLLDNLLTLLQSPKRFVQEQALSTIATVADSAEDAFSRYYDALMPNLFNVLRTDHGKDHRLLKAKAMECATLIALAVGKERMGHDALGLVQILGAIQDNITDDDDPQASYLLHCWGRMCRVLGPDFLPFLKDVMPPLLKLAQSKADIQLLDDEENVAQMEQEEGWELVPLKGKYIGIKTSTLDDKHMAIELINVYAQHLEIAFEPYVLEIMEKVALPGLGFFFHDPVRVASAKCVPALLNSYKLAHGVQSQQFQHLWNGTVEKILEVLETEPAIETLAEMYQCFYESVEVCGKNCLSSEHMAIFITAAESVLQEYQKRVKGRFEDAQDREDGDEAGEDELFAIEDDQTLLSDMNKAFHTIFKNQGISFLQHWQRLLNYYSTFVTNPDPTQRQWALCIFDDVLEFCGAESWRYSSHIIDPLIDGIRDNVPANRQAAAYGAGVAAHKGGEAWSDFACVSLPVLFTATGRPDAREDDHVFATENACASIAKILHYNKSKVQNEQQYIEEWLKTLPVVNDEEAAPYAYAYLAQLIDNQNPALQNADTAAKCFRYVAEALEAETLQGQIAQRIAGALKNLIIFANLDPAQLLAQLPYETQQTVRTFF
ncbi:importin subunit beta-3 [Elasticomyces elasticus]|nr:importin subunit beta-3 [Elasticomyces elasticus]